MNYPEIFNNLGDRLAILNNITSNKLKRRINGKFIFDFKCYEQRFKTEYLTLDNFIKTKDQLFKIVYIDGNHDSTGKMVYDIKCEHVIYELIKDSVDSYTQTGTPTEILTNLLNGTDFTVGTIDFTNPIVFAVNRNANKLNILISLANSLGGELDFSNNGYTIDILNSVGQDNNYRVEINKNLKSINKIVENRGELKATYKFKILNIFKSNELIEKGLEDLEKVNIGDIIYLRDNLLNIDTTQSVYEISEDVIKNKMIDIVTGNNFDLISDAISFLQETAIKQTDIIYGIKINSDVGMEVERADKKARSIFNADEFKMQTGDGAGNYIDAVYFNPSTGKYYFDGTLAANIVEANNISVSQLSAISANLGTVTAGTIIGALIKTAVSGERLEINSNNLNTYNSLNQKHGIQIERGKYFGALDFYDLGNLKCTVELQGDNSLLLRSFDERVGIVAEKDLTVTSTSEAIALYALNGLIDLQSDDVRIKGVSINQFKSLAGNGIDITNSASGATIIIDPSETAGDGLKEDGSENFAVDATVARTEGQAIQFQYFSDHLEVRLGTGSWKVINYD
jgi:hypothetical protein